MSLDVWVSFLVASMLLCFTPGPTVFLVMGQSLNHGKKSVIPLVAGVLSGDFISLSLSLLGVGALLSTSATLFLFVKWIGAGYLIYLGIKSWRMKVEGADTSTFNDVISNEKPSNKTVSKTMLSSMVYRDSLFVTALNPKSIIFFMAFFPLFIDPVKAALPQMLILATSFLVISAMSVTCYSLFSGYLRSKVKSEKFQRGFNKVSGCMLVGAGAITATIQK